MIRKKNISVWRWTTKEPSSYLLKLVLSALISSNVSIGYDSAKPKISNIIYIKQICWGELQSQYIQGQNNKK